MKAQLQFFIESCGDTFKLEINLINQIENSTDLISKISDIYSHIESYAQQHRTLNYLVTYVESIPYMASFSFNKGIAQGKNFMVIQHSLEPAVRSHFIRAVKSIEIIITHCPNN